jgi:MoxR-like ATPase
MWDHHGEVIGTNPGGPLSRPGIYYESKAFLLGNFAKEDLHKEAAMSFMDLSKLTGEPVPPPQIEPVDTDQLKFLRKSLNTASLPEIKDLIQEELVNYHAYGKIELKKGDETRELPPDIRHHLFKEILEAVDANIPVALIGPAGSGKSTVVNQVAKAINLKYYLQNSVSGTHELAGYMDAHGRYHGTTFRTAFEKGGVILIDEVDTSDASALKWINTALANGHAMFPDQDEPVQRHADFRILIAANTFGTGADRVYVGANQLDASTLDRFVFFDFNYDLQMEVLLGGNPKWVERVQQLRNAAEKERARVVISPRASIHGSKLLAIGWPQNIVEERLIWKGMDAELKERILAHASGSDAKAVNNMKKADQKKRRFH